MQRLVYRSTATGATDSLLNMATILAESHRNNERDDLTGALGAHAGQFIQVVEGSPQALDSLLRRLSTDRRHRDIQVIGRGPILVRQFGAWQMANARISPALEPLLGDLMTRDHPDETQIVALLHQATQETASG